MIVNLSSVGGKVTFPLGTLYHGSKFAVEGRDDQRSTGRDVAEVIYGAATDGTGQLRYPVGDDAAEVLAQRQALDDESFLGGIRARFGLTST